MVACEVHPLLHFLWETERAQQLLGEGKPDAKTVAEALKKGEHGFAVSTPVVLTDLSLASVAQSRIVRIPRQDMLPLSSRAACP